MSRARNIKPGFFKNDVLAECDPLARILFAGLWCVADREGRLEDRPKKLKAECLPYDDCDVDQLLCQLHERGFVLRYEVTGVKYIQILEFKKHQNPHVKESASTIPAPCKPGANTVQAEKIPERAGLIPDSLLLIPDSLNTSSDEDVSAAQERADGPDPCPHSEIIAAYHELLPELPRVRTWDADRQKLLRTRWRDSAERQTVEWWREFFDYVRRCPFLLGQAQVGDRDPFLADLEWLVRPKNFRKVIEGKYEKRRVA